jgi:tripartite-type tricarboxylate transporter receptor subunit TctC
MPVAVEVTKLEDDRVKLDVAVPEDEVRKQFETLGLEGVGMPPEAFAKFVASEAKGAYEIAARLKAGGQK